MRAQLDGRLYFAFKRIILLLLIAGVAFQTATYFVSLALGFFLFYLTPEGAAIASRFVSGILVYFFLIASAFVPAHLNVGAIFIVLWGIFLVSILISWKGPREDVRKVVAQSFHRPLGSMMNNYLFAFPILASMLTLAQVLIHAVQESQGIPTGTINISDPFELFFSASYSSVAEEVGFRVIPIGGLVGAYILWLGRGTFRPEPLSRKAKLATLAFFYPEGAKLRLGLRCAARDGWIRGLTRFEWLIIVSTALVFGAAHLILGAGWGPGKFTSTFVGGFALGLTYILYGAQASVLLHWFFNFYLLVFGLSSSTYPSQIAPLAGAVDFMIVAFGLSGWIALSVILASKGARYVKKHRQKQDGPQGNLL